MNRKIDITPIVLAAKQRGSTAVKYAAFTVPVLVFTSEAFAQNANTIGGRLQAASTDLTTGGGWLLQLLGYLLGGAAVLTGFYTLWQHMKNPNGQSRLGYGLVSLIVGGMFLSASLWGSFASNTVAGANVTNTGTAQQMTFQ